MLFRRKKPITHALALWLLVGVGGVALIVVSAYALVLVQQNEGTPIAYAPKPTIPAAELPSLFGRVLEVKDGEIGIDSKQPFQTIVVGTLTKITSLSGSVLRLADLNAGALVMATGKDLGGGRLAASAIAVIENPTTPSGLRGTSVGTSLLQAPADWKEWATMPALIGWGKPGSEYLAALRGYDLKAPAVSVELYDGSGKLTARIELDVPGYKHLKPLNDFLDPKAAEARLVQEGIVKSADLVSPDGRYRLDVHANADGSGRTVKFTQLK